MWHPRIKDFLNGFDAPRQIRWSNHQDNLPQDDSHRQFMDEHVSRLEEKIVFICVYNELLKIFGFQSGLKDIYVLYPTHTNQSDRRVVFFVMRTGRRKIEIMLKVGSDPLRIKCLVYQPSIYTNTAKKAGDLEASLKCTSLYSTEGVDIEDISVLIEKIRVSSANA